MSRFSLTQTLVDSDADGYRDATQSAFLRNAARGTVSREVLGQWLANDRLYTHGYIQAVGRTLSFLSLPETVAGEPASATRLFTWLVDALVNIRREMRFFVDTARDFDMAIDLETGADAKLEGLRRFETLFGAMGPGPGLLLPWLECAVVFYGTERCYLDAWRYARRLLGDDDGRSDADGGALRTAFIPCWTSDDFAGFVDELGAIIDDAARAAVQARGEAVAPHLVERALAPWRALLAAEQAFWPAMD